MLLGAGFLNRLGGNSELTLLYTEEALTISHKTGEKKGVAFSSYLLGMLALDEGDFNRAGILFEAGLSYAKDSGDKQILGLLLNGLGEFSRLREDYEGAAEFYEQALLINREVGDLVRQVTNLINLGATALLRKDLEAAGEYYRKGLKISSTMVDMNGTLYCLEGVAGAYWIVRDAQRAALLLGAAEALREANNLALEPADRLPYDRSVRSLSKSMPGKLMAELFAKGRKLDLKEAVALALSQ